MLYMGIDPSISSTGICIINDRGTIQHCQSLNHTLDDPYRLAYIYDSLMSIYENYKPDYICYERQVPQMRFNTNASAIVPLAELAGILKLSFLHYRRYGYPHVICRYPPEDIKRFATGNSRASKEEMMDAVPESQMKKIKAFVPEWSVNDVADAYHAADLCRVLIKGSSQSINKPLINGKEYDLNAYLYYQADRRDTDEGSKSVEQEKNP